MASLPGAPARPATDLPGAARQPHHPDNNCTPPEHRDPGRGNAPRTQARLALPRTRSPQVTAAKHALPCGIRLNHAVDPGSGNPLATVTSPTVAALLGDQMRAQ